MKNAVIVAGARSAIGRAKKGSLRNTRSDDVAAQVIKGMLKDIPDEVINNIGDVVMGCSTPEAYQGQNIARHVMALADLPYQSGAMTVNRFCSSGLQSIAIKSFQIMAGQEKIAIAGGMESMSLIPSTGFNPYVSLDLYKKNPYWFTAMGQTAEFVAEKYGVSRVEQDTFSAESHQKAAAARAAGKFKDEIVPIVAVKDNGKDTFIFDTDEGIRPETTTETLASLKPVFKLNGTVTAGNSSQTSDGAAAVLLMEEDTAKEYGLKPLARFVSFAVAGVEPQYMGIGPIKAIPKALDLAGLEIKDIDLYELNEAFASQSIACIKTLGLPQNRVNVNGGAISMGHPLGCTGSLLTVKLIHEMQRQGGRYGMVTMCIGGGQGAAGIFEVL